MSKNIKRKVILMIAVELIFLIALGGIFASLQTNLSLDDQKVNIQAKLDEMDELVAGADTSAADATVDYDGIYQGKAGSLAFMYQNGVMDGYTRSNMKKAKELLQVDNVLIVNRSGKVLASAQDSKADFRYERYNQLKATLDSGEPSKGFDVTTGKTTYRYYSAKINDNAMVVIEESPEELASLLENTSTWESILSHVTVGLNGFSFAVSAKDYTFLYYPEEEMVGQDALTNGISVDNLEKNAYNWMTINGEKLYCGVTKVDDAYVICAVNSNEIMGSVITTVAIILFAFFVVITLVITYAFFLMKDGGEQEKVPLGQNWFYNKTVGNKISMVTVVGLVAILLISFYMQSIFSLSRQSLSNNQRVKEVERELNYYEDESEQVAKQYDERYLNKAEIAAYIISHNPSLAEREKLSKLSDILDIRAIHVFNQKGVQTATDSNYTNFTLSDNPEDQSYEFRKLLQGMDSLIQEAQRDDVSGEFHQYIGVTMRDSEGNPKGFTQISVVPSKLEDTIDSMQIETVLPKIKVGNDGSIMAVEKAKNKFVYVENEKLIGKDALKSGLTEAQLTDEYSGYLTIGNQKYWASSVETKDHYVYAIVPAENVGGKQFPLVITSVLASLIALIIVTLLLTLSKRATEEAEREALFAAEAADEARTDGADETNEEDKPKKGTSAAGRWSISAVHWEDKTPEQKIFVVFKALLGILAAAICIGVLLQDKLFDSTSVISYVLGGTWARGVNIFALTGSVMIICVASVLTIIIKYLLAALARNLNAKGETVCRMVSNFVKYISVLAMLYYCLALLGIDTATLLASAGIMSLVIGLGAQSLVADILAGLFIIFEGEFQVGDIVTIGDCRGTVMEIGIRTTKIMDGSSNIKIISNKDVTGVLNMTRDYSYCWVDVGIEYGESLERVELILEKEFPNIKEHVPGIIDGPFYKGVVALADSSVIIRVMVLCSEGDRFQMERDLNREMKLIFDKYDINIPFPQVVLNEPTKFKKATKKEQEQAQRFHDEQRKLSSDLVEEDEEDR